MRRVMVSVNLLMVLLVADVGAETSRIVREGAVAEACGDRVFRFHASASARAACPPSLALVRLLPAVGETPADWPLLPAFYRVHGRPAGRIDTQPGTSLYGTGEVCGPLLRNGSRIVAWNFDAYGYGPQTPHLYQSHPWVLAVRADGTAFGVLADTSERCLIDLSSGILFVAEGPEFPLLVIDRDSPQEVLMALAELTGTMALPPRWSLGYHQCRYSYTPDARVREVAREFRQRRIPCDVIWLDIDYMDGFRSFTFHPHDFPQPERLTKDLHDLGFHTVAILDPGIKEEPGYFVYDSGTQADVWVRTWDGQPYRGSVWPGICVFPDFTRAQVRRWWAGLLPDFLARGIDGIWNDMNEPAIFHVASKTMPLDNVHRADPELGGPGPHARYHNVYGMLMARASREGALSARPDRRPFVLTRANFIGGQRYAATWSGDNWATWEHLELSIPMVLNLGLSGQAFCGPDIGGFAGAGSPEMFARWMGFGALLPFARGHTGKGNIDKEPWAFGPQVEHTCRLALQRRYRLIPYLYTLFREAARTGLPVARPLFFADAVDPALREVDDAFLLGADLLVAASMTPDGGNSRCRPAGTWRRLALESQEPLPDLPDLFVRGGAVLPLGPAMEYVDEMLLDPLELVICLDETGRASGLLYEDSGEGFGYRQGEYRLIRFRALLADDAVIVDGEVVSGDWPRPDRRLLAHLLTEDGTVRAEGRSTETLQIRLTAQAGAHPAR